MTEKTIAYRIPAAPLGMAYYRKGTLYEPGSVVRLPADEVPPGWTRDENGKLSPFKRNAKTKKIMPGKRHPHAWLEERPGLVKDLEARDAKASAKEQLEELRKQLEEQERLVDELEGQAPTTDDGDAGDEGEGAEDAAEDAGEPAEAEEKGEKKKGRKRAADAEL
jgi:hypothetical protein